MSIHVIILRSRLRTPFFLNNGPGYFKASNDQTDLLIFFLNLDFICLRVPELITTNNHFSYKTNSSWWNMKSAKSYCGYIRKISGYV